MLVQTGNQSEFLAAGLKKSFPASYPDFLEGFQTIRDEGRTDHKQSLRSIGRHSLDFAVGVRLQPGITAEPRLKSDRIFFLRHTGFFNKGLHRLEALRTVTRRMRRTAHFAAIRHPQAMIASR